MFAYNFHSAKMLQIVKSELRRSRSVDYSTDVKSHFHLAVAHLNFMHVKSSRGSTVWRGNNSSNKGKWRRHRAVHYRRVPRRQQQQRSNQYHIIRSRRPPLLHIVSNNTFAACGGEYILFYWSTDEIYLKE